MRIFIFALFSMFLVGCTPNEPMPIDSNNIMVDVDMTPPSALLEGTLGESVDFSTDAYAVIESQTSNSVRFSVYSMEYERASMALFHIGQGSMDHSDFSVGSNWSSERTYGSSYNHLSPNGMELIIMGCEGPQAGNWTTDENASWVSVSVEPVDEYTKRIYFDMDFDNIQESIRGYLDLPRN